MQKGFRGRGRVSAFLLRPQEGWSLGGCLLEFCSLGVFWGCVGLVSHDFKLFVASLRLVRMDLDSGIFKRDLLMITKGP